MWKKIQEWPSIFLTRVFVCVRLLVCASVSALVWAEPAGLGCGGFTAHHISSRKGGWGCQRPGLRLELPCRESLSPLEEVFKNWNTIWFRLCDWGPNVCVFVWVNELRHFSDFILCMVFMCMHTQAYFCMQVLVYLDPKLTDNLGWVDFTWTYIFSFHYIFTPHGSLN